MPVLPTPTVSTKGKEALDLCGLKLAMDELLVPRARVHGIPVHLVEQAPKAAQNWLVLWRAIRHVVLLPRCPFPPPEGPYRRRSRWVVFHASPSIRTVINALAGMSMEDARGEVPAAARLKVVKAAFFFVLGFTIVYTAAGAMIGFAAQRVGDSPTFVDWQRWLGIIGGTIILLMALRMAAKVRAPLVCKMPILSGMAQRKGTAKPWEMMVAGLAFATGCMTCFGAALVIAMVVYIGASGSAAIGALVLFLFSLGMGIPLVLAAMAMAKALPMLFKLEKIVPWMGLASSLLMAGFALLLITGNYMTVSNRFMHFLQDSALGLG